MTSRRFRTQFRPTLDLLDRRDVPSGVSFDPPAYTSCDTTVLPTWDPSNTTTTTATSWPSPLVVSGPSSPA